MGLLELTPAALEIRAATYLGAALAIGGLGAYVMHRFDDGRIADTQAQFATYRAQVSTDHAAASQALAEALKAQIDQRNAIETHNAQLQTSLRASQADAVAAHSDAEFARRLLASAAQDARAGAAGAPVPKTASRRGADGTASASGDRTPSTLLADVTDSAAECRDAIQRLAALQLELAPQL